jgi:hypothetical protein
MSKTILLIGFMVLLIIAGPWLAIWALNTLFPVLAIEFTFWTWLAVILLHGFFNPYRSK